MRLCRNAPGFAIGPIIDAKVSMVDLFRKRGQIEWRVSLGTGKLSKWDKVRSIELFWLHMAHVFVLCCILYMHEKLARIQLRWYTWCSTVIQRYSQKVNGCYSTTTGATNVTHSLFERGNKFFFPRILHMNLLSRSIQPNFTVTTTISQYIRKPINQCNNKSTGFCEILTS